VGGPSLMHCNEMHRQIHEEFLIAGLRNLDYMGRLGGWYDQYRRRFRRGPGDYQNGFVSLIVVSLHQSRVCG